LEELTIIVYNLFLLKIHIYKQYRGIWIAFFEDEKRLFAPWGLKVYRSMIFEDSKL